MDDKTLTPKEEAELPFNYSLYPVKLETKENKAKRAQPKPIEFCDAYNATLLVNKPYKKVIEY